MRSECYQLQSIFLTVNFTDKLLRSYLFVLFFTFSIISPSFHNIGCQSTFFVCVSVTYCSCNCNSFLITPLPTLPSFATYAQYMLMRNIFLRAAFLLASAVTFLERREFMPPPFSSREYPLETNSHTLATSNEHFHSQFG